MALVSLLVCSDAKSVQVLSRVLREIGLEVEHCGNLQSAATRVRDQRFDAVLVDCEAESEAMRLLNAARESSPNSAALLIAVVDATNNVRELFAQGANFALYKPISEERAGNSLRAARSLMRNERRRKPRLPVPGNTSIAYVDIENANAKLVDLSEDGIAVRSDRRLPPRCKVYFQFSLPKQVSTIRLSGDVVWQDFSGRVGLRFDRVPQASRKVLNSWLTESLTDNLEAGPPPPMISADDPRHPGTLVSSSQPESSSDRRSETRQTCRLGAEVYRIGAGVPQWCNLSDLSSHGCYVETTEPLAEGTPIELVVRAEGVRVQVRGMVRSSHRGYGMGVEFNLNTTEDREQVKQLLEAQTKLEQPEADKTQPVEKE